jgi:DNA-binding transcriptional MerR regulator
MGNGIRRIYMEKGEFIKRMLDTNMQITLLAHYLEQYQQNASALEYTYSLVTILDKRWKGEKEEINRLAKDMSYTTILTYKNSLERLKKQIYNAVEYEIQIQNHIKELNEFFNKRIL